MTLLISFIKRPHQSLAGIGVATFVRLMSNAGGLFSDEKWQEVVLSLKEAATETLPDFATIVHGMEDIDMGSAAESITPTYGVSSDTSITTKEMEVQRHSKLELAISDTKCRTAVQLLLIHVSYLLFISRTLLSLPHICLISFILRVTKLPLI